MCSTFGHACRTHSSRAFQTAEFLKFTPRRCRTTPIFSPFRICAAPIFSHRPIRAIPIFLPCHRPYKRKNAGQPFLTDRQPYSLITQLQAPHLPLFHFPCYFNCPHTGSQAHLPSGSPFRLPSPSGAPDIPAAVSPGSSGRSSTAPPNSSALLSPSR